MPKKLPAKKVSPELEQWYKELAALKRKRASAVDIRGVEDRIKFLGGTIPKEG